MMKLDLRVVMVNTTHAGNIGAAARAMKTMALDQLYLVSPRNYPSEEATARASGADDLLEKAVVCGSLEEALAGCTWVVGASARIRSIQWPLLDPRECAVKAVAEGCQGKVALVFGREATGLTNDELDLCHALVHIPTNEAFSSLNVAMAIQVLCYEVMMARRGERVLHAAEPDFPLATQDEMEGLYAHIEQTLHDIDFLKPERPGNMMRRLRRLFHRARVDQNEVNILRGIMAAVQKVGRK